MNRAAFFSDNGSTAVEAAMKMAYQHCRQSGRSSKRKFVAFAHSYHGDTCGAMSVTADGTFTSAYEDMRIEVFRCQQGQRTFDPDKDWVRDLRATLHAHHDEIAAVIIEPLVQGAGGMIAWPLTAVQEVCRLCRKLDVLVIFDEVMTGFGRTGSIFAFEQIGVVPDFLCLSKGLTGGVLPLGLTLTTDEIFHSFFSDQSSKMFFHGHSFTGNALSCAAACANLNIFKSTDVLAQVARLQKAHHRGIENLRTRVDVRDWRVVGGIGAVELSDAFSYGSESSRALSRYCLDNGLFIRTLGDVVYLMPPYCTRESELEDAWSLVTEALLTTANALRHHTESAEL